MIAEDCAWRPQWRVDLITDYKAHRVAEPVPAGLVAHLSVITQLLEHIGIDVVGVADYEAEDVIATLTRLAAGAVEIASGGRDLFALVEDPRVRVLYPERSGLAVIDETEITRRYAIPGRRYADFAICAATLRRTSRAQRRRRRDRGCDDPPLRRHRGCAARPPAAPGRSRVPRGRDHRRAAGRRSPDRAPARPTRSLTRQRARPPVARRTPHSRELGSDRLLSALASLTP